MFLKTLYMKNYRKFRDQLIEFPEGVIGVIGPNGVGKSTILEAVGWALYGNNMARTGKGQVRSQNADESEACIVELEFDMGGHSYKVVRELKGKNASSNALVYIDGGGEPQAQKDRGVNEYIEGLMGMDYVTFNRTVYAKQKDVAALSTLTPGERKGVIRRLLNIDRIDVVITTMRADRRDIQEMIKGIELGMEDIDEMKAKKKQVSDRLKSIKADYAKLKEENAAMAQEFEAIKAQKKAQELKYTVYNELKREMTGFSNKKDEKAKQLEEAIKDERELQAKKLKLKEIEPLEAQYEQAGKDKLQMEALRLGYQDKVRLAEDIKRDTDDLEARLEHIARLMIDIGPYAGADKEAEKVELDIREAESGRKSLQSKAKQVQSIVSVLEAKMKELEEQRQDILKLGPDTKCPTCFRQMGDDYETIKAHLDSEAAKVNEELDKAKKARHGVEGELEKADSLIDALVAAKDIANSKKVEASRLAQSLKEHETEKTKLAARLEQTNKKMATVAGIEFDEKDYTSLCQRFDELVKIRDQILGLRQDVERLGRLEQQIRALGEDIKKIDQALEANKNKLAKLDFDEKRYDKIKAVFDDTYSRISASEVAKQEMIGNIKLAEQEQKNIETALKSHKERQKKIEESKADIRYLVRLESLMEDFRLELTGRIRPLLESRVSFLFREVTNGRYPIVELGEDYEISILDGDSSFEVNRFSGGEEDLVNLCLRIAMSQVIAERSGGAEVNFIALDEIFGSQDEERRKSIMESLSRLSSQFRQIMLITHIEDIKEMFPRVLNVEEDTLTKESTVVLQ